MNENEKLLIRYAKSYYAWMAEEGEDETINHCADRAKKLHEEVIALMEHEPVRWIDGAVEKPDGSCDVRQLAKRDAAGVITVCRKEEVLSTGAWELFYWLPVSDFPMPENPEVIIPPCPVCGSECRRPFGASEGNLLCGKSGCAYRVNSIEVHIALCRRLK